MAPASRTLSASRALTAALVAALAAAPALAPALLSGCGAKGGAAAAPEAGSGLKKPHEDMATAFARAVVAKDYDGAFGCTSSHYQSSVGRADFLKAISIYRDRFGPELKLAFKLRASGSTPEQIRADKLMMSFVTDESARAGIVEEVSISFDPEGEVDGWLLVAWIVEEGGAPKILTFYQES